MTSKTTETTAAINTVEVVTVFVISSTDKRQSKETIYLSVDAACEFMDTENATLTATATRVKAEGGRPNLAQYELTARRALKEGSSYTLVYPRAGEVRTGDVKMDILQILQGGGQLSDSQKMALAKMLAE